MPPKKAKLPVNAEAAAESNEVGLKALILQLMAGQDGMKASHEALVAEVSAMKRGNQVMITTHTPQP